MLISLTDLHVGLGQYHNDLCETTTEEGNDFAYPARHIANLNSSCNSLTASSTPFGPLYCIARVSPGP